METSLADYVETLKNMLDNKTVNYILVETQYTIHHIERLTSTQTDRGRFKWIAETKPAAVVNNDAEAKRSHIDEGDQFPRLYFLENSLVNELIQFIIKRGLSVLNIIAPKAQI